MITKTAWKNVWRNKVRSMVVIASVTVGIFAGVYSVAVMEGAIAQRLDDALNLEISHIQVNHPDFRTSNELFSCLENTATLEEKIRNTDGIAGVSSRLLVTGMANTASKSTGVIINGIDPVAEKKVTDLSEKLLDNTGGYIDENESGNQVFIGADLAKTLNIIRFVINDETIDSLVSAGMPAELTERLRPLTGIRFKNEKMFNREMNSILGRKEMQKYGYLLKETAQTFRLGSKLTLTFVDKDNYHTGGMFRVSGIYDISNNMYESSQVFVHAEVLRRLTGLTNNQSHVIFVRLMDVDDTDAVTGNLREKLPGTEVLNWKEIQPDLAMMEGMAKMMYGVFMMVILAALAFGIVNTMLMVVLERTKELGMLAAIGMNRKKVFRMILTESVFLSLIGGVFGMTLSKIIIALTARNGIRFSGYQEGFEAMGYSSHIYPHIGNDFFLLVTVLIILTGILSAIYPAIKALKLDPADALRTE